MENFRKILVCWILIPLYACGQGGNTSIDEGDLDGNTYISEEIGWAIQIPEDWNVVLRDQMEANMQKGKEAIEEVQGEVDVSELKFLISFQKDQFNMFQSTSEPFELQYDGEWEENNQYVRDLIYATYQNKGLGVDTTSSKMLVDGLEFQGFHITIYSPQGDVILYQDMYSRHINGYDFGVNINYNNDEDREVMMTAWKNSTFIRD